MSEERDVAFGKLAIAKGLVSQQAVQVSYRGRGARTLREVLVGRGLLTVEQAAAIDADLALAQGGTIATPPPAGSGTVVAPPPGAGATVVTQPPSEGLAAMAVSDTLISVPVPHGKAPLLPAVGGALGDYEVVGLLGRGAMGAVMRGRHRTTGEEVAIKVILVSEGVSQDALARFRREMTAMGKVDRGASVVHIRASGTYGAGKLPYAVMDFIEGHDFERELTGQPLPLDRTLDVLEAVARAVHACHEAGVIHRDLKPANILIRERDRRPFVADFGVARVSEMTRLTATGQMLGTPLYMSPEQALGEVRDQDHRSDVYALGAILYQCLTGAPPFRAASQAELVTKISFEKAVSPLTLVPALPPGISEIALKCLAKERGDRYQSALELACDLARVRGGERVDAKLVTQEELVVRAAKRNWWKILATLAVVLATPVAFVAREAVLRSKVAAALAQAARSGVKASELTPLIDVLENNHAAASVVARIRRQQLDLRFDEAAAELEPLPPPSRDVPKLLGTTRSAVPVIDRASLVGEGPGFVVGLALLDRHEGLYDDADPVRAARDRASLLEATASLVRARLEKTPGDLPARALRAYSTLAAAGAPVRALGPGTLELDAKLVDGVLPDLEAARELAGEPGERAAWLLVDLLVAGGAANDARARAAYEMASARAPGSPLRAALSRVLGTEPDAARVGKLVSELGDKPEIGKLAELSRVLARAGLPEALEHVELAASPSATALAQALAHDPQGAFAHVAPPAQSPAQEHELKAPILEAWAHASQTHAPGDIMAALKYSGDQLAKEQRAHYEEHWPAAAKALSAVFALEPLNPLAQACAGDVARRRLSGLVWMLLESRVHERRLRDVSDCINATDRKTTLAGVASSYYPEDVFELAGSPVEVLEKFDARLHEDLELDRKELLEGVKDRKPLDELLERAAAGARALRRLEVLIETPPDKGPARDAIVFETLRGFHELARLGGPIVLPFRAQVRRIVFGGRAGEALASLDLARAALAIEGARMDDRFITYALYSLARAGTPLEPLDGITEPLQKQLVKLVVECTHEQAVATASRSGDKKEETLRHELGVNLDVGATTWVAVMGVAKLLVGVSREPRPEDLERLGKAYEFRSLKAGGDRRR